MNEEVISNYKIIDKIGGMGIGLAVARNVIDAHRGSIELKESYQRAEHYREIRKTAVAGHKVVFEIILPKGVRK